MSLAAGGNNQYARPGRANQAGLSATKAVLVTARLCCNTQCAPSAAPAECPTTTLGLSFRVPSSWSKKPDTLGKDKFKLACGVVKA